MARTPRAQDVTVLWWSLAGIVASIIVTVLVVVSPLAAALLISACLFFWTFLWKIENFFIAHFTLAFGTLISVPILRLTAAENSLRLVVAALLVATTVAVAVRVKVAPPGVLIVLSTLYFLLSFIATAQVVDDNEWLFYGLELLVAGSAIVFAAATAKLNAWPTVAKVLILATAAEAALAVFEVLRLSTPLWRGGRILPDGTSTWMRNELVASIPRAQGTFGHPLPLAFMLVLGTLTLIRTRGFRLPLKVALFALMGTGVFVSGSRNAIILFVALSALTLALPALLKRVPILLMLGISGLLIAAPFLLDQFDRIVTTGSVFHRVGAFESVSRLISSRGTLAVLFGDGSAATPRLYSEGLLQSDGLAAVDNQYVLTFAQNGLVGLAILVMMIVLAFRRASTTLRVLLLAVAITGMIFDLFTWPATGFTVWFVVAAAIARMSEPGTVSQITEDRPQLRPNAAQPVL